MNRIPERQLRSFVSEALSARDIPPKDAGIIADVLLTANLCGIDSHGVVRLSHYIDRLDNGTIKARPEITFEQTSPTTGVVEGDSGMGHIVTYRAYEHLAEMTKSSGTASVVIRNSSHFGVAGYYVRKLVTHGFAGMAMTPSDAFLIPFGGTKPFFGTNPLAIGFPNPVVDGVALAPVVLDMATTEIPFGKILLAKKEGEPIPPDWGFDKNGKPTTDPDGIVGLHPIAGPKGSGLAMMIELFCSLLAGVPYGPHINKMYHEMDEPRNLGHFLSAWDLSRFRPIEDFTANLGAMVEELHAIPPAEGFDKVFYPGEIEAERSEDRSVNGIPIDDGVLADLDALADRLNIPSVKGEARKWN